MLKRDGHIETLLPLVDPSSTTISIVPVLNFQDMGSLVFTSQQRSGYPYRHMSGDRCGSLSCPSFPHMVTASYRSTNIVNSITFRSWASRAHESTTHRASISVLKYCCSFSLYFICFIMLFSDPFVLMVYIVNLLSYFVH